jgi:hypothetical protein
MSDIPHIQIPKMRSSGDDWCIHYAGFYDKNAPMQKRLTCDVGVNYESVEKKVEFTYCNYGDKHKYTAKVAHPCFKREAHLTDGCAKCHFRTPEELAALHAKRDVEIERMVVARNAILDDLRRRFLEKEPVTAPRDIHRFGTQKNYFCGAGKMACPVCKTGVLHYSRSSYNGHVHAKCTTEKCVAWME